MKKFFLLTVLCFASVMADDQQPTNCTCPPGFKLDCAGTSCTCQFSPPADMPELSIFHQSPTGGQCQTDYTLQVGNNEATCRHKEATKPEKAGWLRVA